MVLPTTGEILKLRVELNMQHIRPIRHSRYCDGFTCAVARKLSALSTNLKMRTASVHVPPEAQVVNQCHADEPEWDGRS